MVDFKGFLAKVRFKRVGKKKPRRLGEPLAVEAAEEEAQAVEETVEKGVPAPGFTALTRAGFKPIKMYPLEEPWSRAIILQNPETGETLYWVDEIELNEAERDVYKKIMDILYWEMEPPKEGVDPYEHFREEAQRVIQRYMLRFGETISPLISWKKVQYYVIRDTVGFGKLDPIMKDEYIEDISCDGVGRPIYVWHREFESIPTNIVFETEDELDKMVVKLAHKAGKHVSVAFPIVDAILPGGHRLAATFKREVSMGGSTFTIRKFREKPFSVVDLLRSGTLSPELAAYFWLAMEFKNTGLIMGVTGAGKSVAGTTRILAVARGKPGVYTFEELWRIYAREAVEVAPGFEVVANPDLLVRSCDPATLRCSWVRPRYLIRHANNKRMYRVKLASGRYLDVTEDHSLLVYRGGSLEPVRPGPGIVGQAVPVLIGLSAAGLSERAFVLEDIFNRASRRGDKLILNVKDEEEAWRLIYILSETGIAASLNYAGGSIRVVVPASALERLSMESGDPEACEADGWSLVESLACGGAILLDRIVAVEELDAGDYRYVYDLEVPGWQSFEANNVLVHNTTLLNVLASMLKPTVKIVTIEDTPELKLTHENWVQLVSRPSYGVGPEKIGEITLFDLVKVSLRYRPDVIIVGEVRGEEAYVLFQAIATGHGGLTTLHAEHIEAAVKRLTSPPMNIPESYIPLMNFAAVIKRVRLYNPDGTYKIARRVTEVWEVRDYGDYPLIARWNPATRKHEVNLSQSIVLRSIAEEVGTDYGWVADEIERRATVLRWLAVEGITDYRRVARYINEYYASPLKLYEKAREGLKSAESFG